VSLAINKVNQLSSPCHQSGEKITQQAVPGKFCSDNPQWGKIKQMEQHDFGVEIHYLDHRVLRIAAHM